jgi:hypothetical protein
MIELVRQANEENIFTKWIFIFFCKEQINHHQALAAGPSVRPEVPARQLA